MGVQASLFSGLAWAGIAIYVIGAAAVLGIMVGAIITVRNLWRGK